VVDRAGNAAEDTTTLAIDRIEIKNVSSGPVEIDPYDSDTSSISYELSRPANVTIEIYRSGTAGSALVATRVDGSLRSTGSHIDSWDGRSNSGAIVARGGYYFSILASDGGGRSVRFNDPANPRLGIAIPPYNVPSITYNGVAQLHNVSFNPYRNDVLQMQYKLNESGNATVYVRPVGASPSSFIVGPPLYTAPGVLRSILWDGRLPNGSIFSGTFNVFFDVPEQVEEDLVIVSPPEIRLDDVRTNPYVVVPTLAGATNLSYSLPRQAEVAIEIFDPNGNFLRTLQEATVQAPGSYSVLWNGRDQLDEVVTVEGSYRLQIRAEDVQTGESVTRRASALVFR
jgi:flagellar hook assembly protein FlgD